MMMFEQLLIPERSILILPLNPHSFLRMSVNSFLLAHAGTPFILIVTEVLLFYVYSNSYHDRIYILVDSAHQTP